MRTKKIVLAALALLAVVVLVLVVLILVLRESEQKKKDGGPGRDGEEQITRDGEPYFPEEFTRRYERRAATAEERAEDLAEIRRMHRELPGNYWLPPIPGEEDQPAPQEQGRKWGENLKLARKIKNKTATPEERQQYFSLRLKMAQDKVSIVEYYLRRAAESPDQKWFSAQDLASGRDAIVETKKQIAKFETEMKQ
ncbi:MAG: hypothetical protein HY042_02790 [Spirochaetia bacterium]|nr:hypothetical protein [Spirochaetia bacterium]